MRSRTHETALPQGLAPQKALVRALRRLLRPLIRLLVEQQIPYLFLADLLKQVYVEVAGRDFALAGKLATDSRISLLTGIHRKEVKRLRAAQGDDQETPRTVSLGAEIVAVWNGDSRFLDADGRPRALPVQAKDEPSFESLVASVSKDIRARSVLDEWLRLGIGHFDERGRVVLDTGVFAPKTGFEEKLYYFGCNLHDHIAAAAHNVRGAEPPFVERSVYYGRLSEEAVRALAEFAEEQGMATLRLVNRRARELKERDSDQDSATRRMRFGIYFFESDIENRSQEEPGDG